MKKFKWGVLIVLVAILSATARHLGDREISIDKRIGVKNLVDRIQFSAQRYDRQASEHDDDHGFLGYADSATSRKNNIWNTRRFHTSCRKGFCKREDVIEINNSLKDIANAIVVVYNDKKYIGSKKDFPNEKDFIKYVKKYLKKYKHCGCDDVSDSYEDDSDEYYDSHSSEEYDSDSIEVFKPKFGKKRKHKRYHLRKGCGCGRRKRFIQISDADLLYNASLNNDTVRMFIDDLKDVLSKSYDDKYRKELDSENHKSVVLRCGGGRCEFLIGRHDDDSIENLLNYFDFWY